MLSRVFNRLASAISGVTLHDVNCGLKAYRAEVVHDLKIYGELHRFMPVLAHERGYRVAELPATTGRATTGGRGTAWSAISGSSTY